MNILTVGSFLPLEAAAAIAFTSAASAITTSCIAIAAFAGGSSFVTTTASMPFTFVASAWLGSD